MLKSGEPTYRAILDAANRIVQERGGERLTLDLTTQEALIRGMIHTYLEEFTRNLTPAPE